MKIKPDILQIANRAGLEIIIDDRQVIIRHKIRFADKSVWGLIFMVCAGVFLIVFPFIEPARVTAKWLSVTIGLLFAIGSVITLIRERLDKLTVTGTTISSRYNLKLASIAVHDNLKIKMKAETIKIGRSGAQRSDFIVVTHFAEDRGSRDIPILRYQMDNSETKDAMKLGNEIIHILNAKLRS